MDEAALDAYIALFHGRVDRYGRYNEQQAWAGKEPLTREVFRKHLTTGPYIGVYPQVVDLCAWGAIDVDGKDHAIDREAKLWDWDAMLQLARWLQSLAARKSIQLHIERTRNGYHLWCFPDTNVMKARDMRRALMAICKAAGYDPKEINPKSEKLAPGQLGNFVRLPYPGGANATERVFIDEAQFAFSGDWGNRIRSLDISGRTPTEDLEDVAKLWTPPPTHTVDFDVEATGDVSAALSKANGLAYTIWRDGGLEGSDRSTTLARLAHILAECGLSPAEMYAVLESTDARHGAKFVSRHDGGRTEITKLVENALNRSEG